MRKENPQDFLCLFPGFVAKHLGNLYIFFCSASLGIQLHVCRWYGGTVHQTITANIYCMLNGCQVPLHQEPSTFYLSNHPMRLVLLLFPLNQGGY